MYSKRALLQHTERELKDRSEAIIQYDKTDPVYKANRAKIDELADEQDSLQAEITELEGKITNPERIKLTKEEFLNVIKTAPDKMRAGSAVEKDRLCRILFLNLRVDNEKVASYLWREPFASMVKATEISAGRGDWI